MELENFPQHFEQKHSEFLEDLKNLREKGSDKDTFEEKHPNILQVVPDERITIKDLEIDENLNLKKDCFEKRSTRSQTKIKGQSKDLNNEKLKNLQKVTVFLKSIKPIKMGNGTNVTKIYLTRNSLNNSNTQEESLPLNSIEEEKRNFKSKESPEKIVPNTKSINEDKNDNKDLINPLPKGDLKEENDPMQTKENLNDNELNNLNLNNNNEDNLFTSEGLIEDPLENIGENDKIACVSLETKLDINPCDFSEQDNCESENDDGISEVILKPKKKDSKKYLSYHCDICNRSYSTKKSYSTHKYNNHNPNRLPKNSLHKCSECNEIFRSALNLKAHKWKHTGIFCDVCGKEFSQVGNMMRHKIRHTGKKDYKCNECNKEFFTLKELQSHAICHTGLMPWMCEICGKPCRDRGVLTAHMRRHTGERPAKCETCGKSFYSFHDLNVHAVTHSSERPFKCDICDSTFQLKKALRIHKRIHSEKQKHVCKICGKGFNQSSGLNSHMRTHDTAEVKNTPSDIKKLKQSLSGPGPESVDETI